MASELEGRVAAVTNPRGLTVRGVDYERLLGEKMKGFSLLKLLDVMEVYEPGLSTAWRETLPPAMHALADPRSITSVSWVPIELYYDGVAFIVARKLGGKAHAGVDVGHMTAAGEINSFFRFVLGFTTPVMVLKMSGRFWRQYYDTSKMEVIRGDNTGCKVVITQWGLTNDATLYELGGSLVAWMEASRARNVRLTRLEITATGQVEIEANWS